MVKIKNKGRQNIIVVAILCATFAVLAAGLALLGGGIYSKIVMQAESNFTSRTALGYIANQIRRCDFDGGVYLGDFGGVEALFLTEEGQGDTKCQTVIYCYDGQLRELYMYVGSDLLPEDGIAVLELELLTLEKSQQGIAITAVELNGQRSSLEIVPRCGVEGG